jgi:hypothetical protein
MNTQSILHENSEKIPEGLYLQLMNTLKLDFDENQNKNTTEVTKLVVVDKRIPRYTHMSKRELLQNIVEKSKDWPDRETVLVGILKMSWWELKKFCISRGNLPIMKENPRWTRQNDILSSEQIRNLVDSSQRLFMRV